MNRRSRPFPEFKTLKPIINYQLSFWFPKFPKPGITEKEDLIQEAFLVYWKCCSSFDKKRGAQFKTYYSLALSDRFKILLQREYTKWKPSIDTESFTSIPYTDIHLSDSFGFISALSDDANLFIDCVFNPPESLKKILQSKEISKQMYKMKITIKQFLGWTSKRLNSVEKEVLEKAIL